MSKVKSIDERGYLWKIPRARPSDVPGSPFMSTRVEVVESWMEIHYLYHAKAKVREGVKEKGPQDGVECKGNVELE